MDDWTKLLFSGFLLDFILLSLVAGFLFIMIKIYQIRKHRKIDIYIRESMAIRATDRATRKAREARSLMRDVAGAAVGAGLSRNTKTRNYATNIEAIKMNIEKDVYKTYDPESQDITRYATRTKLSRAASSTFIGEEKYAEAKKTLASRKASRSTIDQEMG